MKPRVLLMNAIPGRLPTLLYGDASVGGIYLEEYGGEKTFKDLKSFAAEALVPKCNPENLDACSPEARPEMERFMKMTPKALEQFIGDLKKREDDIKEAHKKEFARLQRNYDDRLLEKELGIANAKLHIKMIKEIIASKKRQRSHKHFSLFYQRCMSKQFGVGGQIKFLNEGLAIPPARSPSDL